MISRDEELNALRKELEDTPDALEYTVQRALARRSAARRRKVKRAVFAPLGSLLAVFAAFVLLVNVSPSFAYAAGKIPLIRELAQAVAASPSLSAAVENEYVQPISLEQSENGITARIEYAIVDQKQLNLFFTVEDESGKDLRVDSVLARTGGDLFSAGVTYGSYPGQEGIRKVTADFFDADVPECFVVTLRVYREEDEYKEEPVFAKDDGLLKKSESGEREYLAKLRFTVSLDPYYTAQGESIELNAPIVIGGQALTLEKAEIYPTHMRFTFADDPENSAWLKSLEFYVENEKGERFDGVSNGVSASGSMDSPMMETYMLESAFFAKSKHLTMYITGAKWLNKDCERVLVDLENESMDRVFANVCLEQTVKKQNGWVLTFSAPARGESGYSIFGWNYYGLDGSEYSIDGMSGGGNSFLDEGSGEYVPLNGRFVTQFQLYDYTDDMVWLCPYFSDFTELSSPIAAKIK